MHDEPMERIGKEDCLSAATVDASEMRWRGEREREGERENGGRKGRSRNLIFGGQTMFPNRKLRVKPESRARSARESRARSARESRAKRGMALCSPWI